MTPKKLAQLHALAFSASRAWSEAEFTALLSQPGMIVEGSDRSFILIRVTLDEAEILTLATDPSHRRQGHATAVLAAGERAAQKADATHVFLEVAEDNAAARHLYAQAQYHQVGRRPEYYQRKDESAVAALVLRKQLRVD